MEVPKPTSRVEIVAAMRRIRVCRIVSDRLWLNGEDFSMNSKQKQWKNVK